MKRLLKVIGILGLWIGVTTGAAGDEASSSLMCESTQDLISPTEHLRAVSLDLTGKIPSLSALQEVETEGLVSDSRIQAMLDSPDFEAQTIRFHHKLIWPYVRNNIRLYMGIQIERDWNGANAYYRLDSPNWDRFLRTSPYNPSLNPGGCGDWPEPDPDNIQPIDQGGGIVKEGWVCVKPFFFFQGMNDPQIGSAGDCPVGEVKACAFDAQANLVSPVSGAVCSEANGLDAGCGCGPAMRYCSAFGYFEQAALQSLNEQIRWMVANDRPYYELLTDAPPFVDGQMAHYYKHIAGNPPFAKELVPDLDPIADSGNWVPVSVGTHAAGILTHPVFLTRFQTRRGRTDRYYNSFLCQPFQVPSGGIPPSSDEEMMEPDLQKRPGCKYCHTTIEPVGAYWGHWQEFGTSYMNPVDFPDYDPNCYTCATLGNCDERCRRNYIVRAPTGQELPYLGMLQAYLFLAEEDIDNILTGPRLLVHRTLLDGRLPACVTRNVAVWLLGRQLLPDEEGWLLEIQQAFMASNYDFKGLVRSIVTSDFYRRVR